MNDPLMRIIRNSVGACGARPVIIHGKPPSRISRDVCLLTQASGGKFDKAGLTSQQDYPDGRFARNHFFAPANSPKHSFPLFGACISHAARARCSRSPQNRLCIQACPAASWLVAFTTKAPRNHSGTPCVLCCGPAARSHAEHFHSTVCLEIRGDQ